MASDAGMDVLTDSARRRSGPTGRRVLRLPGRACRRPSALRLSLLRALGDVGVDMLQRAGINVEPRYTDWGSMLQLLAKTGPVEDRRLERVLHLLVRAGSVRPRGACLDPRQRQGGVARLAGQPEAGGVARRVAGPPDDADQKRIAADIQRQAFIDVPYIPAGPNPADAWTYQRTVTDVLTGYAAVLEFA